MEDGFLDAGNGDPDCTACYGRGVTDTPDLEGTPSVRTCTCVIIKDVVENANRGWSNLIRAPKIPSSELMEYTDENLWITGSREVVRSHMRYVALRKGRLWSFKVVSDALLMTAWLSSTVLKRQEIYDPDVMEDIASISLMYHSLEDLVDPPDLLVIQLGVKAARNSAMSEVFSETLTMREYLNKPTWVFDQPHNPFTDDHLCWSQATYGQLQEYKRVMLGMGNYKTRTPVTHLKGNPFPDIVVHTPSRRSLSSMSGGNTGHTKQVAIPKSPVKDDKKKWHK